jgi:hypothetical protein
LTGLDESVHRIVNDPERGITLYSNPTDKDSQVGVSSYMVKACLHSIENCAASPPLVMEVMDSCALNAIMPFSVDDVDAIIGVSFEHPVHGYPLQDKVSADLGRASRGCGGLSVLIKDRSDNSTPDWITWDYIKGRLVIHPQTVAIDLHQFEITVSLIEYPDVSRTQFFDVEVTQCQAYETSIMTNGNGAYTIDYLWG